jgi:phosphatidate cytidylyltransferase
MLRWRVVTALVLAPVVVGAIAYGGWAILVVVLVVVARAAQELARALEPLPFLATFGAGAFPILLSMPYGINGILAGVFLSLLWALLWLAGWPKARTLRALLTLLLMSLWIGVPLAYLGLIEELAGGTYLVLIAVVGPWISDSGAYFAGRFLGRHLLFPSLSPKKTYEGAIGGLLVTMVTVGFVAHKFLGLGPIEAALLLGVAISVFSQAGDLFESILKRLLDLKDLGRALPGHGGILDRIDSLLFTVPAVYYLYIFFAQ